MKKISVLFLAVLLVLTMPSCDSSYYDEPPQNKTSKVIIFDEIAYPNIKKEIKTLSNGYIIEKIEGLNIYQGDIILTEEQVNTLEMYGEIGLVKDIELKGSMLTNPSIKWPNSTIPYVISSNVSNTIRTAIMDAITYIETNTSIRFISRVSQNDYVEFFTGKGNYSNLGRTGGKQLISLESARSAIHEIGHAIGLIHEQCRSDRDDYIQILPNNIISDYLHNYNISSSSHSRIYPFDFGSIMLYSSRSSFGINENLPQMIKRDGSEFSGQRSNLSKYDIEAIENIYSNRTYTTLVTTTRYRDGSTFEHTTVYPASIRVGQKGIINTKTRRLTGTAYASDVRYFTPTIGNISNGKDVDSGNSPNIEIYEAIFSSPIVGTASIPTRGIGVVTLNITVTN